MIIYWAGSEESFHLVLKAEAKLEALMAQPGMTTGRMDEMLASLPPLWKHEGSTAVVSINGPVVQGAAGWMRIFSVLGYDDIAKAAIEAAMHPDTQTMLYHMNTPGGDVAGVVDLANMLGKISSIKPSATHTSELLASAGYWLAAGVKGQITAGPTAIVGSIGVLQVHRDVSKAMEDNGVKVTVLRSGEFKAELNSVEPLTADIKARAEAQLADVHGLFRAQVARGRPNLNAEQLADVTRGQTFLGKRGVQAGLVDSVQSFELALKLLDKQKQSRDTSHNSKGKAMNLTPEQLAQIAAGTPLAAFGFKADGSDMPAEEIAAYRAGAQADTAAAAEVTRLAAVAEAARVQAAAAADTAKPDAVVTLLKEQLTAANTQIGDLQVKLATAGKTSETHDGLLAIARSAVTNMLVPLQASTVAIDGMDAAAVIAEHARVKPLFIEKFKPGQKSEAAGGAAKPAIDPAFLARVATQTKSK